MLKLLLGAIYDDFIATKKFYHSKDITYNYTRSNYVPRQPRQSCLGSLNNAVFPITLQQIYKWWQVSTVKSGNVFF
jgi:hypothetical protein